MSLKINAYIIHLASSLDRNPHARRLCNVLPFSTKIIPATDHSKLTAYEQQCYVRNIIHPFFPFEMKRTEIAVFHSHRRCWKEMLKDEADMALIFEDDVDIQLPVLENMLEVAIPLLRSGDFLRMPLKKRELNIKYLAQHKGIDIIQTNWFGLGAVGQLVTRDAAISLLNRTQSFDRPIEKKYHINWEEAQLPAKQHHMGKLTEK